MKRPKSAPNLEPNTAENEVDGTISRQSFEHEVDKNPIPVWLRWKRTSPQLIAEAEGKLVQRLKCTVECFFVPIFDGSCVIRTLLATPRFRHNNHEHVPIVLIHGFASGIGLWCKNIDALAENRPVYAIDLLGFGRSTRATFPKNACDVENFWIESIEEWRSFVGLSRFIPLGHSFGGYIATVYAFQYPHRVAHLILADPWGFEERPTRSDDEIFRISRDLLLLRLLEIYFKLFNPLGALRGVGPAGRHIIHRVRSDLSAAFDQRQMASERYPETQSSVGKKQQVEFFSDSPPQSAVPQMSDDDSVKLQTTEESRSDCLDNLDGSNVLDYLYHINLQNPSGEVAFKRLCQSMPFPRNPLLHRIDQLDKSIPMTFLMGAKSWIKSTTGTRTRDKRPESYVAIKLFQDSGHHVYADNADAFNEYVNQIASFVDAGIHPQPLEESIQVSGVQRSCLPEHEIWANVSFQLFKDAGHHVYEDDTHAFNDYVNQSASFVDTEIHPHSAEESIQVSGVQRSCLRENKVARKKQLPMKLRSIRSTVSGLRLICSRPQNSPPMERRIVVQT